MSYNMKKHTATTLQIIGMHCTSCAMNIDFTLEDIDGINEARTDYVRQTTVILYDDTKINIEEMIAVITKLGYEAIVQQ